ncbi:MAG: hypothetical protein KTR32_18645 [Granulosicoccus sp.]|nr:hypothetical protein [Granulosicoccus sp.]
MKTQITRTFGLSMTLCGIILVSGHVQAERTLDTLGVIGAQQTHENELTGTLDGFGSNGRTLIVDDTVVELTPVVTYNGNKWSRERLPGELAIGDRIRFELDPASQPSQPVITTIRKIR